MRLFLARLLTPKSHRVVPSYVTGPMQEAATVVCRKRIINPAANYLDEIFQAMLAAL